MLTIFNKIRIVHQILLTHYHLLVHLVFCWPMLVFNLISKSFQIMVQLQFCRKCTSRINSWGSIQQCLWCSKNSPISKGICFELLSLQLEIHLQCDLLFINLIGFVSPSFASPVIEFTIIFKHRFIFNSIPFQPYSILPFYDALMVQELKFAFRNDFW